MAFPNTSAGAMESPEDELLDLLTSHRSATHLKWTYSDQFGGERGSSQILQSQHATAQVEDGPFPWHVGQEKSNPDPRPKQESITVSCSKVPRMSWQNHALGATNDPHVCSMLDEIEEHDQLSLWLPTKKTTAGVVLQHCISVMSTIHDSYAPMSYKFGFSSDPIYRWENK